jgi:hypothetical protein
MNPMNFEALVLQFYSDLTEKGGGGGGEGKGDLINLVWWFDHLIST